MSKFVGRLLCPFFGQVVFTTSNFWTDFGILETQLIIILGQITFNISEFRGHFGFDLFN